MNADEVIASPDNMICVYMYPERGTYTLNDGTTFNKEKPFQLMNREAGLELIRSTPERFREAGKEEVRAFYERNKSNNPSLKRLEMI